MELQAIILWYAKGPVFILVNTVIICIQAQPILISTETNTGSSSSNPVVDKPAGTVENDLLIVGLMNNEGDEETVSPPSGWTLIRETDNSDNIGLLTYYKVAGSSEPSSYTFTQSLGSHWAIGISRIIGAKLSSPIDVSGGTTGFGSSTQAPSVTTTASDCLIFCFYSNETDATYSPAGGTTERYDVPNTTNNLPSNMMASFLQSTPGSTGDKNATASQSDHWAGQQIAIVPDPSFPVEFRNLQASICDNSHVCVSWQTASETNNDFFTIERSRDAFYWKELKIISRVENPTGTSNYQSKDYRPYDGVSYYRIKQTDFSGLSTFSETVSVNLLNRSFLDVRISYNPGNNRVTITGPPSEFGEFRVMNMVGQEVTAMVNISKRDDEEYDIDLLRLPSGRYIISTLHTGHKVYKQ